MERFSHVFPTFFPRFPHVYQSYTKRAHGQCSVIVPAETNSYNSACMAGHHSLLQLRVLLQLFFLMFRA
jgi:hypothetical protein